VPSNSSYSRSALKKVLKEFAAKDVRKHVDNLYKRVEKHFADAEESSQGEKLLPAVWKACEDELLRIREVFVKRITQCYSDSNATLEFSAADVESAFKRQKLGS
jgi:hypothetical protein